MASSGDLRVAYLRVQKAMVPWPLILEFVMFQAKANAGLWASL